MKFIVFVSLLLVFASCKKDNKTEVQELAGFPERIAEGYVSVVENVFLFRREIVSSTNTNRVQFFGKIACVDSADLLTSGLDVGRVSFNNIVMKRIWQGMYYDTTFTAFNSTFHVTNLNSPDSNPKIDFTVLQSLPTFSEFESLPDSIYINGNNRFQLKEYSGCNSIKVLIGYISNMKVVQELSPGETEVSFSLPNAQFPFLDNSKMQLEIIFNQGGTRLLNNRLTYFETSRQITLLSIPISTRHKL